MSHKVLLADDSLTIQKVIKITLASEPYEIDECNSVDELMGALSHNPEIVFLDFSLSDEEDGYDLARKVKAASPSSKVLMLFGTFDTVDYEALNSAGVEAQIIKPFDSNKFIEICAELLNTEARVPEVIENEAEEDEVAIEEEVEEVELEGEGELPPVLGEEEDAIDTELEEDLPEEVEEIEAELEEIEEELEEVELDDELPEIDDSLENSEEDIESEEGELAADGEETGEKDLSQFPKEPPESGFKNDELEFPEIDSIIQHWDHATESLVDPQKGIVKPPRPDHLSLVESEETEGEEIEGEAVEEETEEIALEAQADGDELPPVMEEETDEVNSEAEEIETVEEVSVEEEVELTAALPDEDDLEYPDMTALSSEEDEAIDTGLEEDRIPEFASMDELAPEEEVEEEEYGELSLEADGTDTEEELKNIAMQIEEEEDEDDLWSIDDGISAVASSPDMSAPMEPEETISVSELEEEEDDMSDDNFDEQAKILTQETLQAPAQELSMPQINTEEIAREVQAQIEKRIAAIVQDVVDDKVREYCRNQVDRVAWEVIPDLAENVVKAELAKISESVMQDQ